MKDKQSSEKRNKDYDSETKRDGSTMNDEGQREKKQGNQMEERNQERNNENRTNQPGDREQKDLPADEDQESQTDEEVDNPSGKSTTRNPNTQK